MLTLYGTLSSGNVYKVRLLLSHLGLQHRRVEVSQVEGHPRDPKYLAINPIGKVPALRFPDGRILSESGAILYYLARDTPYWPEDPWQQAGVLRWMFFEQYSHEPHLAVNRYILNFMDQATRAGCTDKLAENNTRGYHALEAMEQHLLGNDWFGADDCSIADIALYAYTHVAGEGGFDLRSYPAIGQWLGRIAGRPRHIGLMDETSVGQPLFFEEI